MVKEANIINWKAGDTVYSVDDDSKCAYLLKDGEVEVLSNNGIRVGFVNKNEIFGEQSVLLNTKRTVTIRATKDSSAIVIPKKTIVSEFNNASKIIRAILRSTYLRLTNLDNTIKENLDNINK